MKAPENSGAGGAGALPARDCGAAGEGKSTPARSRSQQRAGARTVAAYLGTALRHSREAVALNLAHSPNSRIRREIVRARVALDSAEWICSNAEASR